MQGLGLKQFRYEGSLSYLIFDSASGSGMLVDPRADLLEDYRQWIAEKRIQLRTVLDTRLHWHHLSGTHLVAESFGAQIAMSAKTVSKRAKRRLSGGEGLEVGRWQFEVIETPGVSADAICLRGGGLLLSGDTLLAGVGARTDMPGADPAALWVSQREVLGVLPATTVILPGYDQQDLLFSILDVEKSRGPDWQYPSRAEFVRAKEEERSVRGDGDINRRLEYNEAEHPADTAESHFGGTSGASAASAQPSGVATINVEKLFHKIKEPSPYNVYIDVREPEEFAQGHIPGMRNIPLSGLALHWAEFKSARRIYISCQSGRRSYIAANTLDYIGFPDVVNVAGGFRAWEHAGFSVAGR